MRVPPQPSARSPLRLAFSLGALGIVYGDIGTSPLYAVAACFRALPGVDRTLAVLGSISLILWALLLVVVFKYIVFIIRADNRGEGGIFALLALAAERRPVVKTGVGLATIVILAGAALLFGDGVITPAISVLSAAEGFKAIDPAFGRWVVPIATVILAALFRIQHKGTERIGRCFGPVMLVWFATIGLLGLGQIVQTPDVLRAIDPRWGFRVLTHFPGTAMALLGGVVLAVTGTEALYADLGHFGRRRISDTWFVAVLPALALNYLGQGAWALAHPNSSANPFFALAPAPWLIGPLTLLSIAAAIIASQALISGTYSLTRQAIQLGYLPRLTVLHTNPDERGQIFLPFINAALGIASICTVIGFESSDALASAYGLAVTGTMLVTTFAFYRVVRRRWRWSWWHAGLICGGFALIDGAFLAANLPKIAEGGWLPLTIAAALLLVMHTWKAAKLEISRRIYANEVTEDELGLIVRSPRVHRVQGCGVFMAGMPRGTPLVLLHHVKSNRALPETVIILSVATAEVPAVDAAARFVLTDLHYGVWRVVAQYGYMESPNVSALLEAVRARGVPLSLPQTTFYFNREAVVSGGASILWEWQKSLYAFLSRNARPVRDYYQIPPNQIIEIGLPVQL